MSYPVVALVLGLVLLISAAGLFLRASGQEHRSGKGTPPGGEGSTGFTGTAGRDRVTGQDARGADRGRPRRNPGESRPAASSPRSPGDVPSPAVPAADADVPAVPVTPGTPQRSEEVPGHGPGPTAAPTSGGLFGARRGRRNWAASHGFEYTREDAFLTVEWPVSLIRLMTPTDSGPTARDLVSGFVDGHQLHIADVAGSTVFALRRGAYSPVDVHISAVAAVPAGMRHDRALDRPPFSVYTTDVRAAARLMDVRVDTALRGLTGDVSDVAFSGAWVAVRCPRRTDPDRWDALLPHLTALGTASRVLPPLVTSATLDITVADPTRPRPASGARVAPVLPDAGHGPGEVPEEAPARPRDRADSPRPGHLRAVPDSPPQASEARTPEARTSEARTTGESPAPGAGAEGSSPELKQDLRQDLDQDAVPSAAEVEEHPTVERSAEPVEFPTRARGRILGDADLDGTWPEDVAEDGLTRIPALGEEPSPTPGPDPGDPRIIRAGTSATIFSDGPGIGAGIGDPEPRRTPRRPRRGRHRGPEARHADTGGAGTGRDDAEVYDVVDPEIIDPED